MKITILFAVGIASVVGLSLTAVLATGRFGSESGRFGPGSGRNRRCWAGFDLTPPGADRSRGHLWPSEHPHQRPVSL